MKILVSTHHLLRYSGTETYTLTLIRSLSKLNHQITIYSNYYNQDLIEFQKINNVNVVSNLKQIQNKHFDIAHVHHNINVIEIRHIFPNLPIVFQSHGIKPFLEQPPLIDLNISKYLAISDEVKTNLIDHLIPTSKINMFKNLFDENYFFPRLKLNNTIKSALVYSNYNHPNKDNLLIKICNILNIELDFMGGMYGEINNDELNLKLNQYDVIFTIGRGVIETILAGRIPFVIGNNSFEGFVTPENFNNLSNVNFSGRYSPKLNSEKKIINELSKYNSNIQSDIFKLAVKYYGATKNINKLINIYNLAISSFKAKKIDTITVQFMYNLIQTTRDYEQLSSYNKTLELSILKQSKFYGMYHLIQRIKKEIDNLI